MEDEERAILAALLEQLPACGAENCGAVATRMAGDEYGDCDFCCEEHGSAFLPVPWAQALTLARTAPLARRLEHDRRAAVLLRVHRRLLTWALAALKVVADQDPAVAEPEAVRGASNALHEWALADDALRSEERR